MQNNFTEIFDSLSLKDNHHFEIDMHSHILHNLDHGPSDIENSVDICKVIKHLGVNKIIITPHVMNGFYENSNEIILQKTEELHLKLVEEEVDLKLKAAAEYYVDDNFFAILKRNGKLLTLDDQQNHLLIEAPLLSGYDFLKYTVERLIVFGYSPVLAHTEKYNSIFEDSSKLFSLKKMGLKFQTDLISTFPNAPKSKKENLTFLIDNDLIDFVGSNVHSVSQCADLLTYRNHNQLDKLLDISKKNHMLDF
ncbi:MAG: hypothetical protein IPP61_21740 [Cytophagaceae bacterium]|nr:hypothetical protein [Cytophagaceae bacterium]MBL0300803.1 hypothetical protein [Cytophagaceae bacterium]MBL0327746.1 hypothetical protein [Cytophagaceae bacterium]